MPEAQLESIEFQNGVVAGFHMAAFHLAHNEPLIKLTERADWDRGFNAGMLIRLNKEAEGSGVARAWLEFFMERNTDE